MQQLAYNLNKIICDYESSSNIRRFYKNITYLNSCIAKNIERNLFDDYKYCIKIIYDDIIINGEEDHTIINDCINILRQILLRLLLFE